MSEVNQNHDIRNKQNAEKIENSKEITHSSFNQEDMIPRTQAVEEVRKACRQFAMLYFHFSKTLVDHFGKERAKDLIQETIFNLAIERSNLLREKASQKNLDFTIENMRYITDIPFLGWDKSRGKHHCPYGEQWLSYYEENEWFKEFAPFYCDVIDTTNAENFTRSTSHRITENVVSGGASCERVYYPSDNVKEGKYTYGVYEEQRK